MKVEINSNWVRPTKILASPLFGSLSDKNIGILLIFLILITSVLSVPIRSMFYGGYTRLIYTLLEIALYLILLLMILIRGKFVYNKLDLPVYLYLSYGFILFLWSLLNGNEFYSVIVNFKIFIIPMLLYFVVRYYLHYDFSLMNKLKLFLFIVILLVEAELFFEFFSLKFFGYNLMDLPWVEYIQTQRTGFEYDLSQGALRVVSIFAYPHNAGVLSVVGFFLFYLQNKITPRITYKLLTTICFIGIFFASARVAFVGLALGVLYVGKSHLKFLLNFFIFGSIILFGFLSFAGSSFDQSYLEAHQIGFERFLEPTDNNLNLFVFQDDAFKNIIYLFMGVGFGNYDELVSKYMALSVYGIEIRLITSLLFQYGLIFLFILGWMFYQIYKVKNFDITIIFYKVILLQFAVSLVHYHEMFTIGVFEVFVVIYAITAAHIINAKKLQILPNHRSPKQKRDEVVEKIFIPID